jgi:hypothetical protein
LYAHLLQFGRLKKDKVVPDYIKECSARQLKIFYDSIVDGDGDCNGAIYSSYEKLINDFSEIILKIGWNPTVSIKTKKGKKLKIEGNSTSAKRDGFVITVNKKQLNPYYDPSTYNPNTVHGKKLKIEENDLGQKWVDYVGYVYCAEVPNHVLFVQRNGKSIFCGNSMAGTALKGAIDALLSPTAKEKELMQQLTERMGGVSLQIKDSAGDFIGFRKIIEQLETAGLRGDEALRLFGLRAGPGMAALLNQGSDAMDDMVGKLKNAGGTAEEIAAQMEAGIGGQIRKTISAFEAFRISVGEALGPEVIEFLKVFRETIGDLEIAIIQMKQNGDFDGWGDAAIDVLKGVGFAIKKVVQAFNILANLSNIVLAAAAGNTKAAKEELLRFQGTVDKFLGIYEDPKPLHLFKIDQKQRKEVADEAKKVFEAIGKGADEEDIPEKILPVASMASQLKAAMIRLNAELDIQAQKIEQDYAAGIIQLDGYYAQRLEVIKKRTGQELAILQNKFANETDVSKKAILNAQIFALDQKLVADTISLETEKAGEQAKLDADALKKTENLAKLKIKAEKAYQDQKARILEEGGTTLDTAFAKELADLQTKQNSELDIVNEFHEAKLEALRQAKASELDIELAFQEQKKAVEDQLEVQQAEKAQLAVDQQVRATAYKLDTVKQMAAGTTQIFEQLYELTGKKNKALFYAAKGAAVAEATINIAQGVTKAIAQGGLYGIVTGAIVAAAGAVQIGTILSQGLATGGEVEGSSPTKSADNINIRATAGEFMQPVDAVQYYGKDRMEAIRNMSIPKEALSGFRMGARSPGVRYGRAAFASGGGVTASSGSPSTQKDQATTIVNVLDPTVFEQYTASEPGKRSILNIMSENIFEVKQMLTES